MLFTIAYGLYLVLTIYFYVIIGYILLSWIEPIRRTKFYEALGIVVSPFMDTFRGWIVIGMIDLTPMIGLFLYNYGLRFFLIFLSTL